MKQLASTTLGLLTALSFSVLGACEGPAGAALDGRDDSFAGGKADGFVNDCTLRKVLEILNDDRLSGEQLVEAGVHGQAAENIMRFRAGVDGVEGTEDDLRFESLEELDAVPFVGPKAVEALAAPFAGECQPVAAGSVGEVEVIFTPQPIERSHVGRVAALIDRAARSVDMAIYSMHQGVVTDALVRAAARGVSIRVIFNKANEDRKAPEGTVSALLEEAGIDVRYVNVIMHHKVTIVDGVRADFDELKGATLVTGSGNYSDHSAERYSDNTLFIRGNVEAILSYQREFNHLWDNSRDLVWNESIVTTGSLPIDAARIPDQAHYESLFTSANFVVKDSARFGATFSVDESSRVAGDRWVEAIRSAKRSIWIASAHLRSRHVLETLLEVAAQRPELDLRVYTDGAEFLSQSTAGKQVTKRNKCVAEAGDDPAALVECETTEWRYARDLHVAGIPIRFKFYAYRWHYEYSKQMHNKLMIVDGQTLVVGSFNLSDNSEHGTLENTSVFSADGYPELLADYEANFRSMWETNRDLFAPMLEEIATGADDLRLVFEPMALGYDEVTQLKTAIAAECADINENPYRFKPQEHLTCPR